MITIHSSLILMLLLAISDSYAQTRARTQQRSAERPATGSAQRRATPQVTTTERGYEAYKANFCNDQSPNNGEAILRDLEKANEEAYQQMDRIKVQLNGEIAALAIINDTMKAKADYLASLKKLTEGSPEEAATVQSIRSAFDSASVLFAVKMLSETGPQNFDADTLKNRYCPRMNDPKACTEWLFKSIKTKSVEFLANAYEKVKDRASLNSNIAAILQNMPERFAPQVTIALLQDHPVLKDKADPKVTGQMLNCLDENKKDNSKECRDFFSKPENQDLIKSVVNEGQKIQSSIAPLAPEIKAAVEKSQIDLERHSAVLNQAIADSENEKNQNEKKYKDAVEKCVRFMNEKFADSPAMRESCKMEEISRATQEAVQNIKTNVKKLNDLSVSDPTGKFNTVEIFKIYATNKYLCQCTGTKKIQWKNQTSCYNVDTASSSILYKLDGEVSDVLKRMNFSTQHAYFTDKCASNPDLLLEAKNKCDHNAGKDPVYGKICAIISNENALAEEKQEKDKQWENLNRDYYVKPDGNGGFTKTKKKSNWAIVGEGIKPVLPGLVPMWMANQQMKSQINLLTQQALAEKQYYHNIDIYNQNPWMYSYQYYQANYFQLFGSPFIGTPLPATTTTTTYGTNPGYNFSP